MAARRHMFRFPTSRVFHVLKASEGGPASTQREMLAELKRQGIRASRDESVLVGHYAVRVFDVQRATTLRKAERILR